MKLYIIRHLPTSWNKKGVLQGKVDVPILPPSKEVLASIESNKAKLASVPFDHILTSEYRRTRETAELYQLSPLKPEPLVNELDFGPYEGRPKSELIEENSPAWQENVLELTLGESLAEFQGRLLELLEKYRHCQNLLIFGHGAVTRGLMALHRDGSIAKMNTFVVPNNHLVALDF